MTNVALPDKRPAARLGGSNRSPFPAPLDRPARVSVVVHALHLNPIVRAAPIAAALQRLGFDVELIGILDQLAGVYAPYAQAFPYKTATRLSELPRLMTGDVIYACKPLPTTLLPAIVASQFGSNRPVLLDVEDDDFGVCRRSRLVRCMKGLRDACKTPLGILHPIAHVSRFRCAATTASTSILQDFYGGTRLLHGPNEQQFDPSRADLNRVDARHQFNLPANDLLVLFAGRPSQHKGFDEIVTAVAQTDCSLVLAGDPGGDLFRQAKARLGQKCFLAGLVSNDAMPVLLTAVDIVPVPQHDVPFARAQLPAKLLEAMSMEKAVIASDVGDLADIVGRGRRDCRGWVIRPGHAEGLASAIKEIGASPELAAERSRNARQFFKQHASVSANARVLRSVFQQTSRLRRFL